MPSDNFTGSINLATGAQIGSIEDQHDFEFTIPTVLGNDVTIDGKDEQGGACTWFSPQGAVIKAGSTSVPVEAVMESGVGQWFTYIVTGMQYAQNVHVVVSDSMGTHGKKAS
jgi:hypothetical protein